MGRTSCFFVGSRITTCLPKHLEIEPTRNCELTVLLHVQVGHFDSEQQTLLSKAGEKCLQVNLNRELEAREYSITSMKRK